MNEEQQAKKKILEEASTHIESLVNKSLEIIEVACPQDLEYAIFLTKVVSKLSPLVGNMLEYYIVEHLNKNLPDDSKGHWIRQDPGFPDTSYIDEFEIPPGIEIKAWFPLATEVTARFKDSSTHFTDEDIYVALIAWIPEYIFFGKPVIIDACFVSALEIAQARDAHYHNPPEYLVIEPNDTSGRTSNLQQSNTSGYVAQFEKDTDMYADALTDVQGWGANGKIYSPEGLYQIQISALKAKYEYKLDTNYAKLNRIECKPINDFKERVYKSTHLGKTIKKWKKILKHPMKDDNKNQIKELITNNNELQP